MCYATLLGSRILKRLPDLCKVCIPVLLTSALDGGEWLVSRPGRFSRRSDVSVCPLKRGLGMRRSRSGSFDEEKNSTHWSSRPYIGVHGERHPSCRRSEWFTAALIWVFIHLVPAGF